MSSRHRLLYCWNSWTESLSYIGLVRAEEWLSNHEIGNSELEIPDHFSAVTRSKSSPYNAVNRLGNKTN